MLIIGGDYNSGSLAVPFAGAIADLRVYDRVLTTSDIALLAAPASR